MSDTEVSQSESNEFLAEMLSPDAQKLYNRVRSQLDHGNLKMRWFTDRELGRSCNFSGRRLELAKSEISRSGLLVVIPGSVQTQFVIPEQE